MMRRRHPESIKERLSLTKEPFYIEFMGYISWPGIGAMPLASLIAFVKGLGWAWMLLLASFVLYLGLRGRWTRLANRDQQLMESGQRGKWLMLAVIIVVGSVAFLLRGGAIALYNLS